VGFVFYVSVCVCFVICGCFDNCVGDFGIRVYEVCTFIYCVVYCLYCVFILFRYVYLFLFVFSVPV